MKSSEKKSEKNTQAGRKNKKEEQRGRLAAPYGLRNELSYRNFLRLVPTSLDA